MKERLYRYTDRPMTWTRAIIAGWLIFVFVILFVGQLPSWIIYKADQDINSIIDLSKKIPLVADEGLNPTQIAIIRDIVANTVQMGILVVILVVAYYWQKGKQKRTGAKSLTDPVKGYMSGK